MTPYVTTFVQEYDCLLLDLDGTVFRGHEPTEGAVAALADAGIRKLYVTNNASRSADEVAAHLCELGFSAGAVRRRHQRPERGAPAGPASCPPGARCSWWAPSRSPVRSRRSGCGRSASSSDQPVAVVQGHSPATGWSDLAEAALAIRAGALWVAANVDKTLPSERGLLPGNGSMVAALRTATDTEPQVAGKPAPTLMADALSRGDFHAPLVVGDRLDTDIAGANAAGLPSLMVLSGVNSARDVVFAIVEQRPTYVAHDLRALHTDPATAAVTAQPRGAPTSDGARITVSANGADPGQDGLSVVRATARAVWDIGTSDVTVVAGDDTARAALQRWSLLS